jgi:hypothetical protein
MEETRRGLDLRVMLGLLAVILTAAALWGASALAAGGSSSGERGKGDSPAMATVQNQADRPDHDCPNRGRNSQDTADV